ncbi:unnamed protein product [Caenorhabditis angaria]|uniref:C-type lectin domain-containing protein n=1 Tax=Caenorhabditis angaria TaxID=860376 RepID=A0A9P1IIH8_9PELO|nr:unnamed protein product [Caenorhabditis angaria]
MKYIILICFINIAESQYNPIPCYPGQSCNPLNLQPPYPPPPPHPQIQLFLSPQYISASVPISQFPSPGYPSQQQYFSYPIDYSSSYQQPQSQEVYQQTTIYDNSENENNNPVGSINLEEGNYEFQQDDQSTSEPDMDIEVKHDVLENNHEMNKNVSDSSEKEISSSTRGESNDQTSKHQLPPRKSKSSAKPPPLQIAPLRSSKCSAGWRMMSRNKGKWCMKVFGGTLNVWDAHNECNKQGASLSGVENEQERDFIHAQGVHILRSLNKNIQQGSVWIGAKRRNQCLGDNKNAAGCVPWAPNAFEWTDGFTSGKNMFRFRPGQPDYLQNAQEFIYMHIVDKPFGIGSAGATPGSLDDINGSITSSSQNLQFVRGYVCGKPASFD